MPRPDAEARAIWLHDLRNTINTASVAAHVVRRLLEEGKVEPALGFLADMGNTFERCRKLVDQPPFTLPVAGRRDQ